MHNVNVERADDTDSEVGWSGDPADELLLRGGAEPEPVDETRGAAAAECDSESAAWDKDSTSEDSDF